MEDIVEQLDQQVKTEKSHVQWYFDENEKLKIQTAKMADTIRTIERSKFEFEQSVRELSDTNKDLNNDVKRLEQKLEIYTELFDKDSNFHTSLKRRSLQADHQEQADEKLIENALAPLMEEIKEKDSQIRNLQKAVEEKEIIVNSLNKEIDTLETNLAAMVMEKIRNMHVSNESDNAGETTEGLFTYDSLNELKQNAKTNKEPQATSVATLSYIEENQKIRIGEPCTLLLSTTELSRDKQNVNTSPNLSPTRSSPPKETYLALTSKTLSSSPPKEAPGGQLIITASASAAPSSPPKTSPNVKENDLDELSLTRNDFYRLLQEHEDCIKKKDEQFNIDQPATTSSTSVGHQQPPPASPTRSNIYRTIESAILDQYRGEEHHSDMTSNIPSLDDNRRIGGSPPYTSFMEAAANAAGLNYNHVNSNVDNKSMFNIAENKKLVSDMYDQLAQLEDLVAEKYSQKKSPVDVDSSATAEEKPEEGNTSTKENVAETYSQITKADDTNNSSTTGETKSSAMENCSGSEHENINDNAAVSVSAKRTSSICRRQSSRESSLGLPSNATLLCRTPSSSSTLSQDSSTIDLSGLDELLAEVDQKGSHEKYNSIVQVSRAYPICLSR